MLAEDHGRPSLFTELPLKVRVDVAAWSGSAPFFVLPSYVLHLSETTPVGATVMRAKAANRVGVPLRSLHFSLKDNDEVCSCQAENELPLCAAEFNAFF